jgi:hypothetical protein
MRKFFLKHCKPYRWFISKMFGIPHPAHLSIPWNIYGDFNVHYLGYDKEGNVRKGFRNIFEAIKNRGDLGLTVMYDKY